MKKNKNKRNGEICDKETGICYDPIITNEKYPDLTKSQISRLKKAEKLLRTENFSSVGSGDRGLVIDTRDGKQILIKGHGGSSQKNKAENDLRNWYGM